jgi:hypothetical protein
MKYSPARAELRLAWHFESQSGVLAGKYSSFANHEYAAVEWSFDFGEG